MIGIVRPESASASREGRAYLIVAVLACAALVAVQFGWIPFLRHAWGLNLWQYLPAWASFPLALGVLLLCWTRSRSALLRVVRAVAPRLAARRAAVLATLAAFGLLWLLRERHFQGDSLILIWTMVKRQAHFFFPEIGATFLLQQASRIGADMGWGAGASVQAVICAFGAAALPLFAWAARYLAPDRGGAAIVAGLMLGGGITRIFAGHVEVYVFLLFFTGAYLATALAYLRGRCHWVWPALAFGGGLWTHLCYLFLLPSLAVLPLLAEPGRRPAWVLQRWVVSGLLTLVPTLLFFAAMLAATGTGDFAAAWEKLKLWSTVGATEGYEAWLRPWGEEGPGTRYRILSLAHLKYLGNAFFLLTPALLLLAPILLVRAPRRFLATPEARFLATASLTMVLYTLIVRPVYGPYDWDLFCLAAVIFTALVGHVLVNEVGREAREQLAVLLIGAGALLVTIPFLAINLGPSREAGPFAIDALQREQVLEDADRRFERILEPWL
jgi:hypothetical protein